MTREQCMRERNHREMILHPEWWALDILPLKRRLKDGGIETGYICSGDECRVHEGNIFIQANTTTSTDYDSVDDLLADGWEVD